MKYLAKDGEAAFPRQSPDVDGHFETGMSLRDYFAGAALTGLIINSSSVNPQVPITRRAYELADAMLERRES